MTRAPGALVLAVVALFLLAGCEPRFEDGPPAPPAYPSPCDALVFEGTRFTVCTALPGRHAIGTDLAPPGEEQPYGSMAAFERSLGQRAGRIALAITGGPAAGNGQPIGYFVEEGRRLTVLNESEGEGLFYFRPNGVFLGEPNGPWLVRETRAFATETQERPGFATQSGPMLVIDGELHPAIPPDSASRAIRSAVGVDAQGRALFVFSDDPASLGRLARFYRDVLNAADALYLGGEESQLWDPVAGRMDAGPVPGPLIVVENRAEAGA